MEKQFTVFLIVVSIAAIILKKIYTVDPALPEDQIIQDISDLNKKEVITPTQDMGRMDSAKSIDQTKDTLEIMYSPDGKKKEGLHILLHKNGKKKEEGQYRDNVRTGLWTWWYENGNKWQQGEYIKGERNNTWYIWKKNGDKWKDITYDNGNFITKKEY